MNPYKYACPKCRNREYEQGEIRVTGGPLAKIFDIQNKKFLTISCTHCGYTEIYKKKTSAAGNVVDFFTR